MAEPGSASTGLKIAPAAWLGLLLWITLTPVYGPPDQQLESFWCIACGSRGLADAILNFAFFVPGGLLAGHVLGPRRGVALVVGVVVGIEAVQLFIPGRHPALSDLVFDSAGAWAGALLLTRRGSRLVVRGAAVAAAVAWLAPAVLLEPLTPPVTLWGQWTAEFGNLARYEGRIIEASLGRHSVNSRRFEGPALTKALMLRDPLRVTFVAAPPTTDLAPILTIADRAGDHVLFLGVDGTDVLFRVRTFATKLRLEEPPWWVPAGLHGVAPGDIVELQLIWSGDPMCFVIDATRVCQVTPGLQDGWRLLAASTMPPRAGAAVISSFWCLILGCLLGLAARERIRAFCVALFVAAAGAGLAAASPQVGSEFSGALILIAGGHVGALIARYRRREVIV